MKNRNNLKQTKEAKELYTKKNIVLIELLESGTTKQDVKEIFHCSERTARDMISECAMFYPVIASSSSKGYRIARRIDKMNDAEKKIEFEEVCKTLNEIQSRRKSLAKREKHLIAYLSVLRQEILRKEIIEIEIK